MANTTNAVRQSLALRQKQAEERRLKQVDRVCSSCGALGYSPCQGTGTGHTSWCQGDHIIGLGGKAYYCYTCANDTYSRRVRL